MSDILLRPDLKTPSGEVHDIVIGGKYAGSLSLVYREGDRITGTALIDRQSVSRRQKKKVVQFIRTYMQWLVDALQAPDCEVIVAYGNYDHIIAPEENVGVIEEILDETPFHQPPKGRLNRRGQKSASPVYYELVVVDEKRNKVEYHIYDSRQHEKRLVAQASIKMFGFDVDGEIRWHIRPTEEEIESVLDLIISDFDDSQVDLFFFDLVYDGEVFDTIELWHKDLLEGKDEEAVDEGDDEFSVFLIRDDGDALTYDIYRKSYGNLPVGTATLDLGGKEISGVVELREPVSQKERDKIASALMEEIEDERDVDSLHLTVQHNGEMVDQIIFEMEAAR